MMVEEWIVYFIVVAFLSIMVMLGFELGYKMGRKKEVLR